MSTERLESEELHVTALSLVVQVRALQREALRPEVPAAFSVPGVLDAADALHGHVVRYVADAPVAPDGTVLPEVAAILRVVQEALGLVEDLVGGARGAQADAEAVTGTVAGPAAPVE